MHDQIHLVVNRWRYRLIEMKLLLGALNFLFIAKLVTCESCGPIDILEVNFLLINESASNRIPVNIGDTQSLWELPEFKLDRPTVIYAFDFLENDESISTQIIIDYLQHFRIFTPFDQNFSRAGSKLLFHIELHDLTIQLRETTFRSEKTFD